MMISKPQIAIMGAGMVGSYLYRLLCNAGYDNITIFNKEIRTKCGIHPCAWGTSNGFHELVKAAGLDPEEYILENPGYIMMDEVKVKADLMSFDKPRLIGDLLCDTPVIYSTPNIGEYDRIIDATGISRAYLPPIENDATLECIQYRITSEELLENRTKLGNIGYAWTFPLSDKMYHIGCGSFTTKPLKMLRELGWMKDYEVVCSCGSRIRLTAPKGSLPFVHGNTWGIGEAIGMVSPMAGDGIVPGMLSAQILLQNWNDPEAYTRAILSEFAWMEDERLVIDKLRQGKPLGVSDALVLKKNSQRMGMKIGLKDAAMLLKRLL
jgi:flavin-dependent dehydrogenase